MSEETFLKGFNKMSASERRLWLEDIEIGAFIILPEPGVEKENFEGPRDTGEDDNEDGGEEEAGEAGEVGELDQDDEFLVGTQGNV